VGGDSFVVHMHLWDGRLGMGGWGCRRAAAAQPGSGGGRSRRGGMDRVRGGGRYAGGTCLQRAVQVRVHQLRDHHGGVAVHAGPLELHDGAVAAAAQDGDLAPEVVGGHLVLRLEHLDRHGVHAVQEGLVHLAGRRGGRGTQVYRDGNVEEWEGVVAVVACVGVWAFLSLSGSEKTPTGQCRGRRPARLAELGEQGAWPSWATPGASRRGQRERCLPAQPGRRA
jgi:hypothetical protein